MEIIFLENTDPFVNYVGGIPTYIRNASCHLKKHNIKSHFLGSILNTNIEENSCFDSITSLSEKKIGHFSFLIKLFLKYNKLHINRNHIIHSQRIILCLPFALSFKKFKLVCTSHGIEGETFTRRRGKIAGIFYNIIEWIVIHRLKLLLVVDPRAEKYFKERYPKHANKVRRIPIGIEYERFKPLDKNLCRKKFDLSLDRKIILFLGRIEFQKNLKLLLDSFKLLNVLFPETDLLIAGEGKLLEDYKNYCLKENISSVRFLGGVNFTQTPEIINASDLLVLSSHFEGSPTVVKEALACNVPVVSTDCGDVKYVLDGLEKCYIAEFTPYSMSDKINRSLKDSKIYNYRDRLKHYSNDNTFNDLKNVYSEFFADSLSKL